MHNWKNKKQAGLSLTSTLIALAISSIVMVKVAQAKSSFMTTVKNIETQFELEKVRNIVRAKVSCEQTVLALSNGQTSIQDKSGKHISKKHYKGAFQGKNGVFAINGFPVRFASHSMVDFEIKLEYWHADSGWTSLFNKVPFLCRG